MTSSDDSFIGAARYERIRVRTLKRVRPSISRRGTHAMPDSCTFMQRSISSQLMRALVASLNIHGHEIESSDETQAQC
jgi:hypothetical protein